MIETVAGVLVAIPLPSANWSCRGRSTRWWACRSGQARCPRGCRARAHRDGIGQRQRWGVGVGAGERDRLGHALGRGDRLGVGSGLTHDVDRDGGNGAVERAVVDLEREAVGAEVAGGGCVGEVRRRTRQRAVRRAGRNGVGQREWRRIRVGTGQGDRFRRALGRGDRLGIGGRLADDGERDGGGGAVATPLPAVNWKPSGPK